MEKRTISRTQQLEDVPELIHRIQSLLPVKETARMCILSKSWLNAWSTIPTLRLFPHQFIEHVTDEQERIIRYHQDNIPLESFDLSFNIRNQKSASFAYKWISSVASKNCLKELSFSSWFDSDSFALPDEIFSSENLNRIAVNILFSLGIVNNPVIKCVSLRALDLVSVNISENVLHNLFSTCILLETIDLCLCRGFKTIKVNNLRYLHELKINSIEENNILYIDDVPSLRLFQYSAFKRDGKKPLPFNTYALGSVTHLDLSGVVMDNAFFDMIASKFLFLESLSLASWGLESLVITSVSLKILKLKVNMPTGVQVYAPNLRFFCYEGRETLPFLSFPIIAPKQIKLKLYLKNPIDHLFFVKMREALNLSSKFDIDIIEYNQDTLVSLNTSVDELIRRILNPVTNVQQLTITTTHDERRLWENSQHTRFFDAFFAICHPGYVMATHSYGDDKVFSKLMVKGMMEKKTKYLKEIQLKNPCNGTWETLT